MARDTAALAAFWQDAALRAVEAALHGPGKCVLVTGIPAGEGRLGYAGTLRPAWVRGGRPGADVISAWLIADRARQAAWELYDALARVPLAEDPVNRVVRSAAVRAAYSAYCETLRPCEAAYGELRAAQEASESAANEERP